MDAAKGGVMSKGSFNNDLQAKNANFQALLDAKTAKSEGVLNKVNDRPFSTIPGRTADLQDRKFLTDKVQALELALQKAKSTGGALDIELSELYEVEGRKRILSDEEYNELKENLRQNKLASPITVMTRQGGGFDVLSGNNRVAIYRDLGRTTIKAWVIEVDIQEAEDLAFFANLLNTPLPDYEKYIGFKNLQARHPEMNQQDIANKVGKSKALISSLFAFDGLPEEAIAIIKEKPSILGANAAAQLAALVKKGKAKEVTEVIRQVASGEIEQGQAATIANRNVSSIQKQAISTTPFKLGKSNFCTLRRAKNTLRIEFKDESEAEELENACKEFIINRIEALKLSKKISS